MPAAPLIKAAVGKSGPGICSIKSKTVNSGLSIMAKQALTTSDILCGGILVAIPTAIPEEPFTNKFGTRVGNTSGCISDSS